MTDSLNLLSFKRQLNAIKCEVLETASLVLEAAQPVTLDQSSVGRLSRMDALQGQAMAQANAQRQSILLTEIERALADISSGEYGRCIECDEFIAGSRLEADPVTQSCIACATRYEQG